MKLYKYMAGKRANEFFDQPLLRLTNPYGLNDPFECSIPRELSEEIEKMYTEQGRRDEGFRDYIKNFKSYGVISLSETFDNLLMWSHYADEHRGAVFEFSVEEGNPSSLFLFRNETSIPESKHFGKVDYRKIRKYQGVISTEMISEIRGHYIFTKSDEWMYEKEQRFVLHYSFADIVKVNKKECENAFHCNKLDYSEFESRSGVKAIGEDLWIDIRGSKISAEILEAMWILTSHMKSFFFKIIDFDRVEKIIIGCRNDKISIEQAIKNTENTRAAGKFYRKENFTNVLLARPSEERFELDFEEYRGFFLSMFT